MYDRDGIFRDMRGKRRVLLELEKVYKHNDGITISADKSIRNDIREYAKDFYNRGRRISVSIPKSLNP